MHHLCIALVSVVAALLGLNRPAVWSQYVPGKIRLVVAGQEDTVNGPASASVGDELVHGVDRITLDPADEDILPSPMMNILDDRYSIPTLDEPVFSLEQPYEHTFSAYNPWNHTTSCQLPRSDNRPPILPALAIPMALLLAASILHLCTRSRRDKQQNGYLHRADAEILKFITDMRSLRQSFKDGLDVLLMVADGQANDIFRRVDSKRYSSGEVSPSHHCGLSEPGGQLSLWEELLWDLGEKQDRLDCDGSYASEIEESAVVPPLSITFGPKEETRVLDTVAGQEDLGPPFL